MGSTAASHSSRVPEKGWTGAWVGDDGMGSGWGIHAPRKKGELGRRVLVRRASPLQFDLPSLRRSTLLTVP